MTKDHRQTYSEARVEGAKTLAESYDHYVKAPECFIAGVQYALDKILGQSERLNNIPYPIAGIGDVVPIDTLHLLASDILTHAKERRL